MSNSRFHIGRLATHLVARYEAGRNVYGQQLEEEQKHEIFSNQDNKRESAKRKKDGDDEDDDDDVHGSEVALIYDTYRLYRIWAHSFVL